MSDKRVQLGLRNSAQQAIYEISSSIVEIVNQHKKQRGIETRLVGDNVYDAIWRIVWLRVQTNVDYQLLELLWIP